MAGDCDDPGRHGHGEVHGVHGGEPGAEVRSEGRRVVGFINAWRGGDRFWGLRHESLRGGWVGAQVCVGLIAVCA